MKKLPDEIRELLIGYNMSLADEGIIGKNHDKLVATPDTPFEVRLEHTRWMIVRMLEHPEEYDTTDLVVCIGFVQGVLYMNDNITLQEVRNGWSSVWMGFDE